MKNEVTKRVEQIAQLAKEYYPYDRGNWHCATDAPDSNAPIWCVDENGCIFTMRLCDAIKLYGSWSKFILAEPIEKWKYITKIKEEDEQSTI